MEAGTEIEPPADESIVLNIPANDDNAQCLTPKLPGRLRRRLLESKPHVVSAQDIDAKLHRAYLRRQRLYESVSSKARSNSKAVCSSTQEKYLYLQAKHTAAEQKRLTILSQIQNRLAKVDLLRQNAKNGLQMRFLKELDELNTNMELRLRQAEANRVLLLDACRQKQIAMRERASHLLTRKLVQQKKYRECVRAAIHQKRIAAERKRLELLEVQQLRARASSLKARAGYSSSQEKYLNLQAKQNAAEQKRLAIIAQIKNRFTRMDQSRQNAKNGLQMRFLKKRDELHARVESRMQQAEANRMLHINACRQKQIAMREKSSLSLTRKLTQQRRYRESIRAAIHQKRTSAERKRLGFLEAQQYRARASSLEVLQAAQSREIERTKLHNQLGGHLQKGKKLRAESLRKCGELHNVGQPSSGMAKQKELFIKLMRCWRRFSRLKGTTFSLAKAFKGLEIDQKSVKSMPFENLAEQLASGGTSSKAKALLHRLESCIIIKQETTNAFYMEKIDHLLKRITIPSKGVHATKKSPSKVIVNKRGSRNTVAQHSTKLSRYPVRYVLGAYIISGHPDVVLYGIGKYEIGLVRAAEEFCQEFELLIKIILGGPVHLTEDSCVPIATQPTFSSQLIKFDKAWCSYLRQFVTWKVKDAKLLEEDMFKAASQLEVTAHNYRNLELGMSSTSTPDHSNFPTSSDSSAATKNNIDRSVPLVDSNLDHAIQSIFKQESYKVDSEASSASPGNENGHQRLDQMLVRENAMIVNELVHGHRSVLTESYQGSIKSKVRETMEKAFWDSILETLKEPLPDYSWVLKLIKEVRDELSELSPSSWRQEIDQTIDLDILSQVFQMSTSDFEHCGKILEFSLITLQKLSAPDREDEFKTAHQKLLIELAEISENDRSPASFAIVILRGLRFVLEQIQALKHEVGKVRISMLEPLIKGSAGFEYLRNNFTNQYGSPSEASTRLPIVKQLLSSVLTESEQNWHEHLELLSSVKSSEEENFKHYSPTTLRAGGSVLKLPVSSASSSTPGIEQPECNGEKLDLLLRISLLKLASTVEGLTAESLPETVQLNLFRLRSIQSQFQKIIVICTSILVLRQSIISEKLVTNATEMETAISDCIKQLSELLDNVEDVGISKIVEVINSYPNTEEKNEARKNIMLNMLGKSLSAGDGVFARVSKSVYLAARGIVFGGSGVCGKQLAETELKRIGVSFLTQKLVDAVEGLVVMANVSNSVHFAWYEQILGKI